MEYPKGMIPVLATGIGDCLFNSVGKLLFGTEAVTPILRLLFITGAIGHVDHYIEEYRSRYNTKDCAYEMLYVMSTQEVFEKRPVMESTSVTDIIRFAVISEITELSKKDAYAGERKMAFEVPAASQENMCAALKRLDCIAVVKERQEWVSCRNCGLRYHSACSRLGRKEENLFVAWACL
ncbi:uncharacterized protein LOC135693500 isoform X2 [Rhopilema esculentum]|uniref:uncharacterized protein LOC135693500 isoform X2 n=1 Tax=Rhopilema esculentum TaxID=499914 RepID=UPI0031E07898